MLAKDVLPTLKNCGVLVDGFNIVIDNKKSHGSWVVDARDGKEYLDCFGQFASHVLGWNHPKLIKRLDEIKEIASSKLAHSDVYTTNYAQFVAKLSEKLPEFEKLFFISSGALAVENTLKVAFDWKVQKLGTQDESLINKLDVIHFENAFHGRTGYTMSLTNTDPEKTKWFPKFDWTRVPVEAESLNIIENCLKNNNTAAVIIEPIQGEGGDIHVSQELLQGLRDLTNQYEALLIFDEVQTGMSTGKMWCYQHYGIVPDLLAFGKKIQVCGVAATSRINDVQNAMITPGRINSTWGGDIVDMTRSLIQLEIIDEENLLDHAAKVGNHLISSLKSLDEITNVRGKGSMIAFDLKNTERRDQIVSLLQENMLPLKCGNRSIRLRPHLTFNKTEADMVIKFINEAINK